MTAPKARAREQPGASNLNCLTRAELVKLLDEARRLIGHRGGHEYPIVAVAGPLRGINVASLLDLKSVAGIVLPHGTTLAAGAPTDAVGWFHDPPYDWTLPRKAASWIFLAGPRRRITAAMLLKARAAGARRIVYATALGLRVDSILSMLSRRLGERVLHLAVRNAPAIEAVLGARLERDLALLLDTGRLHRPPGLRFMQTRILLANYSLALGGAERQIVNTLAGLRDRGFHELGLVCERRHDFGVTDSYGRALIERGILIEELPGLPFVPLERGFMELARSLQAVLDRLPVTLGDDVMFCAGLLWNRRPGVVHAWQDATAVKFGLAACLVGVPMIVLGLRNRSPTPFGYWLPWLRSALRTLARQPGVALVNNSAAGARDYERWLGLEPNCMTVLHNGLAPEAVVPAAHDAIAAFRARLNIEPGGQVVGSIFRFYPEKDPLLWLRVAAEVSAHSPQTRFVLIGDGPLLPAMRRTADGLGISGRIVFAGEESDPRAALAAMDVFLLVSRHEGLPNVVLEAQAQGVPVVARSVGGVPEAIDRGATGLLVDSADPAVLAAVVLRVLNEPTWSKSASLRAPVFVAERFGAGRMIDETLRLYGLDKCGSDLRGPSDLGRR